MNDRYFEIGSWYGLQPITKAPTKEEEREFVKRGERDKLVELNLRFAVQMARRYQGRGLELEDLIQESALGLVEAAIRYDPKREGRFVTYAVWFCRRNIRRAIRSAQPIALPHGLFEVLPRYFRAQHALQVKGNGSQPSFDEIYNHAELSVNRENLRQAIALFECTWSPLSGFTVSSELIDVDWEDRLVFALDCHEILNCTVWRLRRDQRRLLWLRHVEEQPLSALAKIYKRSREAIRLRLLVVYNAMQRVAYVAEETGTQAAGGMHERRGAGRRRGKCRQTVARSIQRQRKRHAEGTETHHAGQGIHRRLAARARGYSRRRFEAKETACG